MTPYYQDSKIKIYHGDMREVLLLFGVDYFDLAIADPPYGIDATNAETLKPVFTKCGYRTDFGDAVYDDTQKWDASHFAALMRVSRNQVIFGGNYYSEYLKSSPCWIVWDKDNGTTNFADCELAWTSFPTAVRKLKYRWNGMLQQDMKNKEPRLYPTQKPKALIKWILQTYAKREHVILDPCCGSGTTLRAAYELGMTAIGIDKSLQACEIAKRRLIYNGSLDFDQGENNEAAKSSDSTAPLFTEAKPSLATLPSC